MVSILSVGGYFVRANGGCQTPCLVISACAAAGPHWPGHTHARLAWRTSVTVALRHPCLAGQTTRPSPCPPPPIRFAQLDDGKVVASSPGDSTE